MKDVFVFSITSIPLFIGMGIAVTFIEYTYELSYTFFSISIMLLIFASIAGYLM